MWKKLETARAPFLLLVQKRMPDSKNLNQPDVGLMALAQSMSIRIFFHRRIEVSNCTWPAHSWLNFDLGVSKTRFSLPSRSTLTTTKNPSLHRSFITCFILTTILTGYVRTWHLTQPMSHSLLIILRNWEVLVVATSSCLRLHQYEITIMNADLLEEWQDVVASEAGGSLEAAADNENLIEDKG